MLSAFITVPAYTQIIRLCVFEIFDRVTYCEIVFDIIVREFKSHFKKSTGIEELFDGGVRGRGG